MLGAGASAAVVAALAAVGLVLGGGVGGAPVGEDGTSWVQVTNEAGALVWKKERVEDQAAPERYIRVTRPARMQVFETYSTERIEWDTNESAGEYVSIKLYHSYDNAERYLVTVAHALNTGFFEWEVPRPPTRATLDSLYRLRVQLTSDSWVSGTNDGHFRIVCLANCTLIDEAQAFA